MSNLFAKLVSKFRSFTSGIATDYTSALGAARTRAFAAAPGVALAPSYVPTAADHYKPASTVGNTAAQTKAQRSKAQPSTTLTLPDGTELPADQEKLAEYFRAGADLPTPSLNALDTRSPSYLDIIAYLVDTGRTPARRHDVQEAFAAIHQRVPGPAELEATMSRVADFGLAAR